MVVLETTFSSEFTHSNVSQFLIFNVWCTQEGHEYVNKPAAESCNFVYVCMTFLRTTRVKGLLLLPENIGRH